MRGGVVNGWETDKRRDGAQMEVRFGLREAVRAAGSGFRRVRSCVRRGGGKKG